MTPAARLAAAAIALDRIFAAGGGADRVLTVWGRENRYAGSKDRAAIADAVYLRLRRRRSLGWRMGAEPGADGRALILGGLAEAGCAVEEVSALFCGLGYAPAALTGAERSALADDPGPAPDPVRFDYPDWLDAPLRAALGERFASDMAALRERAPLDLRVNTLKATCEQARARLAEEGVETTSGPVSPLALRVLSGRKVSATDAYADGLVEVQDAASQAVALMACAQPGEVAIDYCAGGGGKALALAAMMENRGRLIAHDVAPRRMADLPARARRAGARIEIAATAPLDALAGACDLALVDAPCSGSGAWRRNPDAKWSLTLERLAQLERAQVQALDMAAACVRPGGRLIYATCSLLPTETADQAAAFLRRHADFAPIRVAELWRGAGLRGVAPTGGGALLTPTRHGTDGFFVAGFRRAQ